MILEKIFYKLIIFFSLVDYVYVNSFYEVKTMLVDFMCVCNEQGMCDFCVMEYHIPPREWACKCGQNFSQCFTEGEPMPNRLVDFRITKKGRFAECPNCTEETYLRDN
jgi:hypothetical protein